MSTPQERAQRVIDSVFRDQGADALYTSPQGGGAVGCVVIVRAEDADVGTRGAMMQRTVLEVRKTEIASPARNGSFAVTSGVFAGVTFKVMSDPKIEDGDRDRLVWVMHAQQQ